MRGIVAISLLLWLGCLCLADDKPKKVEVSEAYFGGMSYIEQDVRNKDDIINTDQNTIVLKFSTIRPMGLIFHGSSSGGSVQDYITIELVGGKLRYSASFGSYQQVTDEHEVYLGEELADGSFHKLLIERKGTEARLYLDEGTKFADEAIAVSKYTKLTLDMFLFIGGTIQVLKGDSPTEKIPLMKGWRPPKNFGQKGLRGVHSTTNFKGCLRDFMFTVSPTKQLNLLSKTSQATKHRVAFECPSTVYNPITFTKKISKCSKKLNVASSSKGSFSFRTYEERGTIFKQGKITINFGQRYIELVVRGKTVSTVNYKLEDPPVNSGLWYDVEFSVTSDVGGLVTLIVNGIKDERPGELLAKEFPADVTIGPGFVGCLQNLKLNGQAVKLDDSICVEGVQYKTCNVSDHCHPNPCLNEGQCKQTGLSFECSCKEDYKGSVCQFSTHFKTCNEIRQDELKKNKNINSPINKNYTIDPDGSGPIQPFLVFCNMTHGRQLEWGMTVILSESKHVKVVVANDKEAAKPESFIRDIRYFPNIEVAKAVALQSEECRQYIEYKCINSKLLNGGDPIYGRWVSAQNKHEKYWGGAKPDSLKCACGMKGTCVDNSKGCNCDAGKSSVEKDAGYLTDTHSLPVTQVLLGDVSVKSKSSANVSVGDLHCSGEINNTATFVNEDGYVQLPRWTPASAGDISFLFRTPYPKGIILHNGLINREYVRVQIVTNQTLRLDFNLGHGKRSIDVKLTSAATLNDRRWHKVVIWHNQKEFGLELDGVTKVQELPLHLSTQLNVEGKLNVGGYSRDQLNGFVGCIKGLTINGRVYDLYAEAKNVQYVKSDCGAACKDHKCMNGAECIDFYNIYNCNCDNVPFYGFFCQREIGASFLSETSKIEYEYPTTETMIGTDIAVAFSTRSCGGTILEIKSGDTSDYFRIRFRANTKQLYFEYETGGSSGRVDLPKPASGSFCDDKRHAVSIRRNRPITTQHLLIRIDNKEVMKNEGNLKSFSKPKNIIIGGEWTGSYYSGCISGVKVVQYRTKDVKTSMIDPIRLWQEKSKLVTAINVVKSQCGPEPPTPLLPTKRIPDSSGLGGDGTDDDDDDKDDGTDTKTDASQVAIIVVVVLILVLVIIALLVLIYWYWSRHKGTYHTHEDDENLQNDEPYIDLQQKQPPPSSGGDTQKKKEWFI